MNRPDIAAFVLGFNSAWMLTAAGITTLMIRRHWTSDDARSMRSGLVAIGIAFGVGAVVALATVPL